MGYSDSDGWCCRIYYDFRTADYYIGTYKYDRGAESIGADNTAVRKIFLSFSVLLIRKGMLWGNIVALSFCILQYYFKIVKLDPATYYVDSVPVELNIGVWLLLNICTLIVSVLMLVGPSYLVSRIHPAKSVRFE